MGPLQIFGLICGCLALLFGAIAAFIYLQIKKLFSLINESQYEEVMPVVEKQKKRITVYLSLSTLCTIATIVLAIANNV